MTNRGKIRFDVWDLAGQEKYAPLHRAENYAGSAGAIIMFDLTARITYKNVPNWYRDIIRVCQEVPMVLVGNKSDMHDRKVTPNLVTFHRMKNMEYCECSAKKMQQTFAMPFLHLARKLTGVDDLYFVETDVSASGSSRTLITQGISSVEQVKGQGQAVTIGQTVSTAAAATSSTGASCTTNGSVDTSNPEFEMAALIGELRAAAKRERALLNIVDECKARLGFQSSGAGDGAWWKEVDNAEDDI